MAASVRFLENDGVTVITAETLADIFAGANDKPHKLGFISTSDRNLVNALISIGAVGTNDGAAMLRSALDSASVTPTLSSPWGFSASVGGATGSWSGTGTYGYKISSTNSRGESGPSPEITAVVDLVTRRVTLSWTQTPGAAGYRIYRTPTPGTYGASTLVAVIGSGATVSYNDDGAATSTGTPASTNTTGGWNLTPVLSAPGAGTWSATGNYFWVVVALDSTGVEIGQTLQATVNVDNTTKTVSLTWGAFAAAASFKVYRSTVSGTYTSPALVATVAGGSTNYVDTGTAVQAGGVTFAPSYGVPPVTFTSSPLSAGTVAPNQEVFFWIVRVTPAGTPEVGNPRQATIDVTEA